MTYILDRFESGFAILETEDRTTLQIPRSDLPSTAREGCVLVKTAGIWTVSDPKTAEAAQRIRKKMDQLWK